MHVAIELGETLLLIAVDIAGAGVAGLPRGLEERLAQRVGCIGPFEDQGPVVAPIVVAARQGGLHTFEVRQAVGVVPTLHARVGRPPLIVHRVAALEDHPIDRR